MNRTMPVDLSVKRVPDDVAERLRERAKLNHRSLQGELRAILEAAAMGVSGPSPSGRPQKTLDELHEKLAAFGMSTPSESTQWIRQDRDSR